MIENKSWLECVFCLKNHILVCFCPKAIPGSWNVCDNENIAIFYPFHSMSATDGDKEKWPRAKEKPWASSNVWSNHQKHALCIHKIHIAECIHSFYDVCLFSCPYRNHLILPKFSWMMVSTRLCVMMWWCHLDGIVYGPHSATLLAAVLCSLSVSPNQHFIVLEWSHYGHNSHCDTQKLESLCDGRAQLYWPNEAYTTQLHRL